MTTTEFKKRSENDILIQISDMLISMATRIKELEFVVESLRKSQSVLRADINTVLKTHNLRSL